VARVPGARIAVVARRQPGQPSGRRRRWKRSAHDRGALSSGALEREIATTSPRRPMRSRTGQAADGTAVAGHVTSRNGPSEVRNKPCFR
jgi:hypothetical protein